MTSLGFRETYTTCDVKIKRYEAGSNPIKRKKYPNGQKKKKKTGRVPQQTVLGLSNEHSVEKGQNVPKWVDTLSDRFVSA